MTTAEAELALALQFPGTVPFELDTNVTLSFRPSPYPAKFRLWLTPTAVVLALGATEGPHTINGGKLSTPVSHQHTHTHTALRKTTNREKRGNLSCAGQLNKVSPQPQPHHTQRAPALPNPHPPVHKHSNTNTQHTSGR